MDRLNVIQAWKEASKDLKIEIETPFQINSTNSTELKFDLLIKNFGSKNGTVILSYEETNDMNIIREYGYYCSGLNYSLYKKYNRDFFIETLYDWGFYGNINDQPDWYTGFQLTK